MLSKVQLTGTIKLESGLHIGGSDAFAAIGAIDLPVIKDSLTNLPILPGTSLKGKMRSLLATAYNEYIAKTPNDDDERILRLFGATTGGGEDGDLPIQARLIFRDAILSNTSELLESGVDSFTEAKFENTINRVTAIANPRQIERVIRGSKFDFELIYDVINPNEVVEDIQTIKDGLKLLELDYLGGSGSRGYGKIKFEDLQAKTVFGDFDASGINEVLGV
jgi:CRISPR-associated protein Csm3